jgi:hypothetical protein
MKFLSTAVLFLVTIAMATALHAQEAPKKADGTATQAAPQSKEDANKDFDSRMAKLQQAESKMQTKLSKAKSPEMRADMEALIRKMRQVTDEYNAMKSTAGMSEQQQEQTKKKIRADLDEVRKMHDNMKAKYGDQMGEKDKKGNPEQMQQQPQQQDAVPK